MPILLKYKQVMANFLIKNIAKVAKYRKSLYNYVDRKCLANKNYQKYCYH